MDSSKPFPVLVEYSIKPEAKEGLRPSTEDFINWGFIIPCISSYKTPGLPGKKPHGQRYRFMQDCATVNKMVIPLFFSISSVSKKVSLASTLPSLRISPDAYKSPSERVVLPASTCAKIPTAIRFIVPPIIQVITTF